MFTWDDSRLVHLNLKNCRNLIYLAGVIAISNYGFSFITMFTLLLVVLVIYSVMMLSTICVVAM